MESSHPRTSALRMGYLESLRRGMQRMDVSLEKFRARFGSHYDPEPYGLSWGIVEAWLEANPNGPTEEKRLSSLAMLRKDLEGLAPIARQYGVPHWDTVLDAAPLEEKRAFVTAAKPFMLALNAYTNLMPLETGRWTADDTRLLFVGAAFDDTSRALEGDEG